MNRNVVATINPNEYKDVLLNKKCLRHLMNRIIKQEPYELNKSSFSFFYDKMYIQNNGYDGLALGY